MNRYVLLFLVIAGCFLLPCMSSQLYAQHGDEPKVVTLAPVVVTAEQILEYVKNHPQNVAVLGRKEIKDRNFLELGEAIASMPGVDVRQGSGSMGARVIIRGGGGTGSVSILVDGRPVNSSQYGGVDLSSIPMEAVDKVYVFKPPVPVWLGPGSSAGAVNIVTRGLEENSLKKKNRGRLQMRGGSYGAGDIRGTYIITQDRGKLILTAGGGHKDGKRPNSDRDSGDLSFNWSGKNKSMTKYDLNCRYYHNYHGCAGPVDNSTPDARQRYQKGSLDFQMDGIMGDASDFSVKTYVDMEDLKDRSQTGGTSTLEGYKIGMSGENIWSGNEGWAMRLGGLAETNGVDHNISGSHHREKVSIHMQYDREIHDFTITLGIRGEYTNDFGWFPALRGGVSYPLGPKTLLKANGGYSVNVPTFNQLYQPSHGSIDQVRGNPDLDEENVYSCDLGLEHNFSKDVALNITLFRTDTRDYITYQRGVDLIYRPVNISRAYKQGVELFLTSEISKTVSVDISYVYQNTEDEDRDDELYYSPQHNIKITGKYHLPTGTKVETILKTVSRRYSSSGAGGAYKLDGYSVVNLKIIQPVPVEIFSGEFFVHLYNLFDTDFESHAGYPDDGFIFTAGLNVNF